LGCGKETLLLLQFYSWKLQACADVQIAHTALDWSAAWVGLVLLGMISVASTLLQDN
jgi:hypothetical protein